MKPNSTNHRCPGRLSRSVAWSFLLIVILAGVSISLGWAKSVAGQIPQTANQLESLWTRAEGDDWPAFLGPTADGKSRETGILTDWTEGQLKVVWKTEVGEGYGMGSVAEGRFIHFDRHAGQARVRCLHAETGKQIWEFRYPSNYRDLYGYDGGPRASPA